VYEITNSNGFPLYRETEISLLRRVGKATSYSNIRIFYRTRHRHTFGVWFRDTVDGTPHNCCSQWQVTQLSILICLISLCPLLQQQCGILGLNFFQRLYASVL